MSAAIEWIPISQLADRILAGWELLEDISIKVDGVTMVRIYRPGVRVYS